MTPEEILDALEFVDCDECRAVGQYRVTGPDTVECQVCGHPYAIGPCDCPDHAEES